MAGPIDPRTLAIIQAMEPAAAQRQAIMARDAVMRGPAPAPMNPVFRPGQDAAPVMPAGLTIAPQGRPMPMPAPPMGMDEFADVRNPIPQPRGPMTAPQPSPADLMPPQTAGRMQPMPQSFETPIGPAPSRMVPPPMPMPAPAPAPAGNMLAPDIETGSIAPAPAAPDPGNRLEAPMPEPVMPGRRVYDPAAGTNAPRFIYEGGPAPMRAAGGGSAIATGGGAVPATGGAGGAAMPYSGGDSGGGMGDGFFDFLGGFSRGGLLGGIQGIQLGKQARAKAGLSAQQENMTRQAAKRLGVPDDVANSLDGKSLASLVIDIQKQNMTPKEAKAPDLQTYYDDQGRERKGYMRPDGTMVPVGGAKAQEVKANWTPLSPEEAKRENLDPNKRWQRSPDGKIDEIGGGGVNISNQVGGERAYDTSIGTYNAETYKATQTAGTNAFKTLATLDRLDALTKDPNFYSGTGGETVTEFKKILGVLGGDPNAAAPNEEFVAITNRLILDASGGTLGAAISNADREFMANTAPTISATPEGNRQRIEVARRLAKRDQDVAKLARDYQKTFGRIDDGFQDVLAQYGEANPLFADMPVGGTPAGTEKPPAGGYPDGTVIENDAGETMVRRNGQWVPQ
jgi:hypothetical protein